MRPESFDSGRMRFIPFFHDSLNHFYFSTLFGKIGKQYSPSKFAKIPGGEYE